MDWGYHELLIGHSLFRWVVLACMLAQALWIARHSYLNSTFSKVHFVMLCCFTAIYNIQLILGLTLYFHSPLVQAFWSAIPAGIKHRQLRFFGMEHITMMCLAVAFINYYTLKASYKIDHQRVFTFLGKRYIWIFLCILSSIPWSFSPLTSRPNIR